MSTESEYRVQEALVEARAAREQFRAMALRARDNAEEATNVYNHAIRLFEEAGRLVAQLEEAS